MKNYKPKNEVIVEEVSRETSTPSVFPVEALIIDCILPYRRMNLDTPIQRLILQ